MRRALLLTAALAMVAATPAMAGDCGGCKKVAQKGEGFCCGKGKIFGVDLTSKKLFAALTGHKVDADKVKCGGCKTALKTDGKCEHCKVAAANGQMFHSQFSHALAKGKPVSAEKAAYCTGCKTAHAENGFCTGCNVGFVAGRKFKNKEDYDVAKTAHATLVKAASAAKKCEACAVAMVSDGECEHCKVSFKDGKKQG